MFLYNIHNSIYFKQWRSEDILHPSWPMAYFYTFAFDAHLVPLGAPAPRDATYLK